MGLSDVRSFSWDFCKVLPALAWLIVCLVAIPAYARIGWVTPIVCAVFSSLLAILATRDILTFLAPSVGKYVIIGGVQNPASLSGSQANIRCGVAVAFVFVTLVFTVLFFVISYALIQPEKSSMPCDGECEGCDSDPNCEAWIQDVEVGDTILFMSRQTMIVESNEASLTHKFYLHFLATRGLYLINFLPSVAHSVWTG